MNDYMKDIINYAGMNLHHDYMIGKVSTLFYYQRLSYLTKLRNNHAV